MNDMKKAAELCAAAERMQKEICAKLERGEIEMPLVEEDRYRDINRKLISGELTRKYDIAQYRNEWRASKGLPALLPNS